MREAVRLALLVAWVGGCEMQPSEAAPTVIKSAELPRDTEAPVGISAEERARRRQAALDLLTDGRSAAELPVAATEPGKKFDSQLHEKLTPKVWVSDGPSGGSRLPQIRQGKAKVQGPLDRDVIRRIVRAHINEIRSCYSAGQKENRKLAGRVTINFVIGGNGKVASAVVEETTLSDTTVGNCIAKAVKRWTFPKPRGGENVIVSYPFELSPG
jgi:outer membrane biosynthesis protein TonB